MLTIVLASICSVLILVSDQLSKYFIVSNYSLGESSPFIRGLINITYVHNNGGAWGILSGYTWVLLAITALIMVVCITLLVCKGAKNKWLFWSISLVLSGGLGNMADRIFRGGNVVDFLQFDFWQTFPVFNIADCAICVGCGVLILYFIIDSVRDAKRKKAERK